MPKGKQSYVPGLGKKSVARHSGEVRKPVSIALSTQFSTRLAPGLQFTLAVNERLTFWCRLRNVFEEVFEKGFRRCRLRDGRKHWRGVPWPDRLPEPRKMPPKRKETDPVISPDQD